MRDSIERRPFFAATANVAFTSIGQGKLLAFVLTGEPGGPIEPWGPRRPSEPFGKQKWF